MIAAAEELAHVETRDLYELYPNLHIDVQDEQRALRRADVVVFQFPIYWFSSPAILKEWQDVVLTREFAYGDGEKALNDKLFMLAVSTGGTLQSYSAEGRHGAELAGYLAPFEQTARFCGMKPVEPFVVQNAGELSSVQLEQTVQDYSSKLVTLGKRTYGS